MGVYTMRRLLETAAEGQMIPKKYRLNDGSIYWHKLYFALMPGFMTKYSLPGLGGYNLAHYLRKPWEIFEDYGREVKFFWQRGTRGYSDRDVWSVDWFLTSIMPSMLQQLKRTTHGAPIGVGMKRWYKKLDHMTETFKIARQIEDYHKDSRKLQTQFNKRMKVFVRYFFNLLD